MAKGPVAIHTPEDIAMARRAALLAADVLQMIAEHVRPGISTNELDRICHDYIVGVQQAIPANVGYHGYPKTICASVNSGDLSRHPVGTRSSRMATSSTSTWP